MKNKLPIVEEDEHKFKFILNMNEHQARELAGFLTGFLHTNEGRACLTPVFKDMSNQILDQSPDQGLRCYLDEGIKLIEQKKDELKRLGAIKFKAVEPTVLIE